MPHKPPSFYLLLFPMTTLKRGKTQQKNNFPLGVLLTVSPWAGVKLSLHLSCVTKWASPKNRPDRCKSLLQTVVYPCPFNLSLSKSTAERVWLCHAYPWQRSATHERCPPQELHMVPAASNITDYRRGFTDARAQVVHPRKRQFFLHNHLGSAIHPDTVNHSERHREG